MLSLACAGGAEGPTAAELRARAAQLRLAAEQRAQVELAAAGESGDGAAAAGPAFLPGTVVWAAVKGWPAWPALVTTHEDADNVGVPGAPHD